MQHLPLVLVLVLVVVLVVDSVFEDEDDDEDENGAWQPQKTTFRTRPFVGRNPSMRLLSTLRTLGRTAFGRRPLQGDLERIIEDLRRKLLRGETPRPPTFPRLKPATALKQLRKHQLRKLKRTIDYARQHL